ncbi:hypothetical protein [Streptomyces sp. NPDC048462]|uniref:hypothetical protein n=1 Tax=Streptomyces sp. NPDC048462 TaxID=3365555 RepID=UPI0037108013
MTDVRHTYSVLGGAVRHASLLATEVVPDAARMSCIEDVVRIELPEGEFSIRLESSAPDSTQLRFRATFRENRLAGGTWWSSWEVEVPAGPGSPEVGEVLATGIRESRRTFARALSDAKYGHAA